MTQTGHAVRRRRLDGVARVWLINAAMAVAVAALVREVIAGLPVPATNLRLPWWALTVMFYLAETFVVHLHFRRDAHSLSLSEVPVILGLFFADPLSLLVAQFVGSSISLRIHRRQPLVKLVFNLSEFALGACACLIVFHAITSRTGTMGMAGWMAAFVGTCIAALIAVIAVMAAITVTEGFPQWRRLGDSVALAWVGTAANASLALIAVDILRTDPAGVWLLVVPVAVLFLSYRGYTTLRQKHRGVEFLYDSAQVIQQFASFEESLLEVLLRTRRMFRAELAEIILFPAALGERARRTIVGPGDRQEIMSAVDLGAVEEAWQQRGKRARGTILRRRDATGVDAAWLATRGVKDALVVPLQGESRLLGLMVAGGRLGAVSTFDSDDLTLLETLASHTSVAVENGRLERSLAQLTELEKRLLHEATHDSLTGLANRAFFIDQLEDALRPEAREGLVTAMFLDLDDFKTVNDSLGHNAGDEILVLVTRRVRACLRASDTPARLGGDELAILLGPIEDAEEATMVAKRVVNSLRNPFLVSGRRVSIGASIGIAMAAPGECTATELLRNADEAMYSVKSHGKNGFAVFEPEMHHAVLRRHGLKGDLEGGMERDEFQVLFQPIVDLRNGAIVMVEALLRWTAPGRGLVSPSEFMPLAEETGLINQLGVWVLNESCAWAAERSRSHPERPVRIAVNVSGRQLEGPDFVGAVADVLRNTKLDPNLLVLEMTESFLGQDLPSMRRVVRDLKDLGVRIAIDDFGTGYSSLGALRSFPVDILKLAKPFVDGVGDGPEEEAFAHAIVGLAQILGIETIAEGIEQEVQAERLRSMGCAMGQGFHFARPLAPERLAERLAQEGDVEPVRPVLRLAT